MPGFRPASAFASRTGIGITMAFMYPGISEQEATKRRFGWSTLRISPVTG